MSSMRMSGRRGTITEQPPPDAVQGSVRMAFSSPERIARIASCWAFVVNVFRFGEPLGDDPCGAQERSTVKPTSWPYESSRVWPSGSRTNT